MLSDIHGSAYGSFLLFFLPTNLLGFVSLPRLACNLPSSNMAGQVAAIIGKYHQVLPVTEVFVLVLRQVLKCHRLASDLLNS